MPTLLRATHTSRRFNPAEFAAHLCDELNDKIGMGIAQVILVFAANSKRIIRAKKVSEDADRVLVFQVWVDAHAPFLIERPITNARWKPRG